MFTCLALWNNDIFRRLSVDRSYINRLCAILNESRINSLFDSSSHFIFFEELLGENSVFNYEQQVANCLATLDTNKLQLPDYIDELQYSILLKLHARHYSNSISEYDFTKIIGALDLSYRRFLLINQTRRIIFSELPHTFADYFFFLLANSLSIECIAIEMVGQYGRHLSYPFDMNRWRVCSPIMTPESRAINLVPLSNVVNQLTSVHGTPPYHKRILDDASRNKHLCSREQKNLVLSGNNAYCDWLTSKVEALRYLKTYSRTVLDSDTIYSIFFLHVEPESTVTPESQPYCNQLDALTHFCHLSRALGLEVLVKEHPDQYHSLYPYSSNAHWQNNKFGWVDRNLSFYNRAREIVGTSSPFLSHSFKVNFDTLNLGLVGTLNGSIGLEAISKGIKIYAYGHPWYCFHPLVSTPQAYPSLDGSSRSMLVQTEALWRGNLDEAIKLIDSIVREFFE